MLIRGSDYAWANLAVTGVGAMFDWRTRRIPNVLTLGMIPVAAAVHAWVAAPGRALEAAAFCVLGAAVCSLGPAILWKAGWVGGGDVKLLAAMGAIGGPTLGVEAAFLAFFCAMSFVVIRLSWHGIFFRTLGSSLTLVTAPLFSRRTAGGQSARAAKGLRLRDLETERDAGERPARDAGRPKPATTTPTPMLDAMRFGPFALAGSALTVLFHGGIL